MVEQYAAIKTAGFQVQAGRYFLDATVLIADNDVRSRDALSRFFADNGFRVAMVDDGLGCLTELVAVRWTCS